MSDETQFILGDAAVDATSEGRRGLLRRRKKRADERPLTHCENCGTPLSGEYCAKCGQHAVDYKRSLWRVLIDAADSFLNWDTKFLSSIGVLLIKPWRLTNDFNAGRRARYVHPLRLYLLASIAFFLMLRFVHFNGEDVIQLTTEDRTQLAATLGKLTGADSSLPTEQQATIESFRSRLTQANGALSAEEKKDLQKMVQAALATKMKERFERGERAQLKAALKRIPQIPDPENPADPGREGAEVGRHAAEMGKHAADIGKDVAEQVHKEVAAEIAAKRAAEPPPAIPAAPGDLAPPIPAPPAVVASPASTPRRKPGIHFGSDDESKPKSPFEQWMQTRIKDKVGEDGTRTKLFLETLRNNIATMMLGCIPLFALVLKMLYLGKRRYYVEHLVYALHIHTFVYIAALVITLIGLGLAQWSNTARVLVTVALSIAVFAQVLVSIRRVYGQGWFFTVFKFSLGGFIYFVILICAVGVTALATLLLPE